MNILELEKLLEPEIKPIYEPSAANVVERYIATLTYKKCAICRNMFENVSHNWCSIDIEHCRKCCSVGGM